MANANGIESTTKESHKWYTYFDSKLVLGDINLVECQDLREAGFVENTAGIKHIAHKSNRAC